MRQTDLYPAKGRVDSRAVARTLEQRPAIMPAESSCAVCSSYASQDVPARDACADAYRKLIYLDWGNGAFVPFNILAYQRPPHTVALNALEGMLRVWPELTEAPMFQTLFLSGAMVLMSTSTDPRLILSDAP